MTPTQPTPEPTPDSKQLMKFAIEIGPLIVFFVAYLKTDMFGATLALIVATLASLLASRLVFGHVAVMPIVTAVLVSVFGGLTLWLQDPSFIKVKPTILYTAFAAVLAGGLWYGKVFLKMVLGEALQYTEAGWRKLTVRWAAFFVTLALLNELVWRNFSEATWVSLKTFGFLPLTLAFAVYQFISMKSYEVDSK